MKFQCLRLDANQRVNMVPFGRASVDNHRLATRDFATQLAATLAHIAGKNRIPALRRPHQVILAVPNRVAVTIAVFRLYKPSTFPRLETQGLLIPCP